MGKKSELNSVLEETAKTLDPIIEEILIGYVDKKNQEIIKYQVSTGGKRLRPALAIICSRLLGGKLRDVLYPAAGLEILHNYSLIIDDIIDHSNLRRDRPTVWAKYGKSIAECIGIDYSASLFQVASHTKEPIKISDFFAITLKTIVDGEILDILFEQKGREDEPYVLKNRYWKISDRDYLNMAGKKTAFLFQTSCELGAIAAGAKKKEVEVLRNYGFNLGIAFQISDDTLDIFGSQKTFGKKIGKDIVERKLGNIVILHALKELNPFERKKFLALLRKEKIRERDVKEGIKLIKKTDSYQKVNLIGRKFAEKARANLSRLPQNRWNRILREIADSVMEREK